MNRAPAIISQPALALEMIIHFGRAALGCRSACLRHPRQFYEDEVQDEGSLTQTVTLPQPLANSLPMFVFLMATQKTKATKTTIKVYSTKPWPSSSTQRRFKSSMRFTSFPSRFFPSATLTLSRRSATVTPPEHKSTRDDPSELWSE